MKPRIVPVLLLILCLVRTHDSVGQPGHRKALFVIVDGISADVIEKIAKPNLDAIAREGGYVRAYVGGQKGTYSQTPTISAVGYNSLLTGTWVNKHNVWDNDIKAPNYQYWTIFRFFESQYPQKKTAVFSTWLDNRTKLVGEGLPATGQLRLDYSFDGWERSTWVVTNAKNLNPYFRNSTPGVVDIMPTLARHLQVSIPKEQSFEIDGVPLTGQLSLTHPTAKKEAGKIALSWKAADPEGNVKIWLTTTNHFEEGQRDRYLLMDEVSVKAEKAVLDVSKLPTGFYKIVLEGRFNTLSR